METAKVIGIIAQSTPLLSTRHHNAATPHACSGQWRRRRGLSPLTRISSLQLLTRLLLGLGIGEFLPHSVYVCGRHVHTLIRISPVGCVSILPLGPAGSRTNERPKLAAVCPCASKQCRKTEANSIRAHSGGRLESRGLDYGLRADEIEPSGQFVGCSLDCGRLWSKCRGTPADRV
jgi:hypothetical protein